MQDNLHHYTIYILNVASEEWYFRGYSSSVENISSAMACASVLFFFFLFFSFITWKHLRFWTNERHRHKSQKGRRHMVSHRYGDVTSIVYLHNTKAVPGSHRERHTYKHISQRWLNANGPLDNIYHHSLRNPLEEWLWSVRLDHVWKKQQNGKRTDNAEDIVLTIQSNLATLREKIHESVTREKNYRRTLAMLLFLAKN